MKYDIKNRWTGAVIFTAEIDCAEDAPTSIQLGLAVRVAVGAGAYLAGADLVDAYLADAYLAGANLARANLAGADLAGADLARANLADADLARANLADANLARANLARADLADADLADADLAGANLAGANLARANLAGADLAGAYLAGANLAGANLARANLAGADLAGAYLAGAYLAGANLAPVRDDLWAVLSSAPAEVEALRAALIAGKVDGSTYTGECACLVGTIANARGVQYTELGVLKPNGARPIERFFMGIRKGDTPENNQFSKLALQWTDEWLTRVRGAFAKGAA